jgi:hypothetical protein
VPNLHVGQESFSSTKKALPRSGRDNKQLHRRANRFSQRPPNSINLPLYLSPTQVDSIRATFFQSNSLLELNIFRRTHPTPLPHQLAIFIFNEIAGDSFRRQMQSYRATTVVRIVACTKMVLIENESMAKS